MVMQDYGGLRATGSNPPQDEGFLSNLFKTFGKLGTERLDQTIPKFIQQYDPQLEIPDIFKKGNIRFAPIAIDFDKFSDPQNIFKDPIETGVRITDILPFGESMVYGGEMTDAERAMSAAFEIAPEGVGPALKGAFPIVAKRLGQSKYMSINPSDEEVISVIKNPETADLLTTPILDTRKDVLGSNTQSGKFFVTSNTPVDKSELTEDFAFKEGLEPSFADPPLPAPSNPNILLRKYTIYDNTNPNLPLYDVDMQAGWNPVTRNKMYDVFSKWATEKGVSPDDIPPSMFYKNQRPMKTDFNPVLQKGSMRSKADPFGDEDNFVLPKFDSSGNMMTNPDGSIIYQELSQPVDRWEQFATRLSGGNRKEKMQDFNDVMETLTSQAGASQLYGKRITGGKRGAQSPMQIFESKQISKKVGQRALQEGTATPESSFVNPGYIGKPRPEDQRLMIDFWKDILTNETMSATGGKTTTESLAKNLEPIQRLIGKQGYPDDTIIKSELENTYFYEALRELSQPDMTNPTGFSEGFATMSKNIDLIKYGMDSYDKNLIDSILPSKVTRDRVIRETTSGTTTDPVDTNIASRLRQLLQQGIR